jgi:hypothetical protein
VFFSVDETTAAIAMELEQDAKKVEELSSKNDKPSALNTSMQSSSIENSDQPRDQHNTAPLKQVNLLDSAELNARARKRSLTILNGTRR